MPQADERTIVHPIPTEKNVITQIAHFAAERGRSISQNDRIKMTD